MLHANAHVATMRAAMVIGVIQALCRLKDFRRLATHYARLALNFLSAIALAAIIAFSV